MTFFFLKEDAYSGFNFFRGCLSIISICFFGLRPQNRLSGPDAYVSLEGVELCGLYFQHVNTLIQYVGCESIPIEAINDKKVGKLGKKYHKNTVI